MSIRPSSFLVSVILGAALSLSLACQSGPKVETRVEEGPGRVVVVQTTQVKATVTAIDAKNHTVSLKRGRRQPKVVKLSEAARNLPQVRVGDEVHVVLIEETVVELVAGGAPAGTDVAAAVALAPEGEMPGAVVADSIETTATVVAIDGHEHTVTLEFADGRVDEVNVGKHRDLSKVGLGDSVRIRVTEAVALSVVRPQE